MMTWLRKRNKEIMLFTFSTFLLGGVVFTGFQGFAQTAFSPVVVVNGDKVPYKRFETMLNRRVAAEQTPPTEEKLAALKAATLQEIVQETAFLQESDRYELAATDNEVAAFLRGIPAFQQNGVFNQSLYLNILQQNLRTTPLEFEADRRRDIRRQKLIMLLSSGIKISEGEVRDRLSRMPEKQRKEFEKKPDEFRNALGQEQGNAAFQVWIQQVNQRLKVDNRLDRWEKKQS